MRGNNIVAKTCDHTSVGMFVWKGVKLLLIERARFPAGFAVPAGHVDGDASFEDAARRELREEVGLEAGDLELLLEKRAENPCRRDDGSWHLWKLYKASVSEDSEVKRSLDETKRAGWYSRDEIAALAAKTEAYRAGKISEQDWIKSPGLEPVMYDWFKELKLI